MENYISISLLKHYFEQANNLIMNAQINNDITQLEAIRSWLDIELSKYVIASDGILKLTYDEEYLSERNNPISYRTVYYMLYSVQYLFGNITSIFFDLYYKFLQKDGVLV